MPPPSEIYLSATCYENVNLSLTGSLTGSRTDLHKHICTTRTQYAPGILMAGALKKEGEDRGGAAEVSDFFIKNPNLKKKKFFSGGGGRDRCD